MNPKLEALFAEPEKGYLQAADLNVLSQFVSSLPERVNLYRRLRNEEVVLQPIADTLERRFAQESPDKLKRSIQNGILMLRYLAMAMLTDNASLVTQRLESWLPEIMTAFDTQAIDQAFHQLLREQLAGRFTPQQMALLQPGFDAAQILLAGQVAEPSTSETLVSLF
jgi:hypothetical protein